MSNPFFVLHSGLDREGPGEAADIKWVAKQIDLPADARICDAACGPGADVAALLAAAPQGHVTAVDMHKPFIDEVLIRVGNDERVTAYAGNMAKLKGPFDLIWCAGAVYFLGIEKALESWRFALAKGGHVAFSEPCFFVDEPSQGARDFWGSDPVSTLLGISDAVKSVGYETVATRKLSDAAWEAYYAGVDARVAALRPTADEELQKVLDESEREAALWRAHRKETGYLLSIVRPV